MLRYSGVAYLLYLAWGTWRDTGSLRLEPAGSPRSVRRVLVDGVTLNLLNPKLTELFFAFLHQFVPAGSPHALAHMLLLSAVFMAMTFGVFATYAVVAGAVRERVLGSAAVMRRLRRSFAVGFAGLAAKLALAPR